VHYGVLVYEGNVVTVMKALTLIYWSWRLECRTILVANKTQVANQKPTCWKPTRRKPATLL